MKNDIDINNLTNFNPDCCNCGLEGMCEICWFTWKECGCGKSSELCSCGTNPNIELSDYIKQYEKNKE